MSKKTYSFNMDEDVVKRLDDRADNITGNSRSYIINRELEAWFTALGVTMREVKQKLSQSEAKLVLDVMNGTAMDTGRAMELWMGSALPTQVADGCELDGLDQKWGINKDALLFKLADMSGFERFALADWAKQVWRLTGTPGENADIWERELRQFKAGIQST